MAKSSKGDSFNRDEVKAIVLEALQELDILGRPRLPQAAPGYGLTLPEILGISHDELQRLVGRRPGGDLGATTPKTDPTQKWTDVCSNPSGGRCGDVIQRSDDD